MKTAFVSFLILAVTAAYSSEECRDEKKPDPQTASFEPCGFWTYDFNSHGYVCDYPNSRITVYTVSEVDAMIRKLQDRIQSLEAQLATR